MTPENINLVVAIAAGVCLAAIALATPMLCGGA
jgi:hypothetical protein